MAESTCPKCDNTMFECVEADIIDLRFKHYFVQCNACGAVVGVLDYYNLGDLLYKIAEKLGIPLD